jgi:hypothetical protein
LVIGINILKGNRMKQKKLVVLGSLILTAVLVLASCATVQSVLGGQSSSQGSGGGQYSGRQGGAGFGLTATTPIQQKLAIGTLKLEGTPNAVTPAEAKTLLPLWQAVKVLPSQTTTAPEEVTALYQQIQDSMTPQQVQAIKDLTMSGTDMRALMTSLGIQPTFGGAGGAGLSQSQIATRTAARASGGGGGFGGPPGGGGFGGPPGGGGFGGGGTGTQTARTPGAGGANRGAGIGTLFVDPVIKLLQTKAGG